MKKLVFLTVLLVLGLPTQPSIAREFDANKIVCGARVSVPAPAAQHLSRFLRQLGIRQVRATVGTIWTVHRTGRLPRCYLTKREARRRGWRPGGNLWRVAIGRSIGGNRFGNRERRLPHGNYVEADLDFRGGRRGAKRLVFDRSTQGRWRIWVTVNHYRSFRRVPPPGRSHPGSGIKQDLRGPHRTKPNRRRSHKGRP